MPIFLDKKQSVIRNMGAGARGSASRSIRFYTILPDNGLDNKNRTCAVF